MKIKTMLAAAFVAASAVQPLCAGVQEANGYEWEFDSVNGDSESVQLLHLMHGPGPAAVTPSPVGNVTIPSELDGCRVKFLGVQSFADCDKMTSVNIPSSVMGIQASAFRGCTSLTRVTLPPTLLGIGESAFEGCSNLTQVTIQAKSDTMSIGAYAFKDCTSLKEVSFPEPLSTIWDGAFSGCTSLESVTISLTGGVCSKAFENCSNLKRIYFYGSDYLLNNDAFSGVSRQCVMYVYNPEEWHDGMEFPGLWNRIPVYNAAIEPQVECEKPLSDLGFFVPAGYVVTVKGLPTGLKYDSKKVAIVGKATMPGLYDVSFTAKSKTDKVGFSDTVKLLVRNYVDEYIPVEDSYGPFTPGVEVCVPIQGAYDCNVSGLPSGMKWTRKDIVDSKTGVVTVPANSAYGAPKQPGNYTVFFSKKVDRVSRRSSTTFKVAPYPVLAVETTGNGAGKVTGAGAYASHKKVSLRAQADKESVFGGWYYGDELLSMAASYQFEMTESDVTLTAKFITLEEDKTDVYAVLDGAFLFDETTTTCSTSVEAGMYLEWPLAVETHSQATVTVSGLPAGLKFTAKDIVDSKTKEVTIPANTIYGIPTAMSKIDKVTGKPVPSNVKITVTTAGKAKFTYILELVVYPLPSWAVGTFEGGGSDGQATMTISAAGKISGKYMVGGQTWTLSGNGFEEYYEDEGAMYYTAKLTAKAGRLATTLLFDVYFDPMMEETDGIAYVYTNGEGELFRLYQTDWKAEPWKTFGAAINGKTFEYEAVDLDENDGTMQLRFSSTGKISAKCSFVTGINPKTNKPIVYTATSSAVLAGPWLVPVAEGRFTAKVFMYFPPKAGKFAGYASDFELEWDGTTFERID